MWVFSLKMLWKNQTDLGTPNTVAENQNRMGHINRIWSTLVCSVNVVFVHQYLFTVTVTYPFPNWSVQCTVVRIWTCFYWKALQRRHFLSLTLASPSPLREMTHFFPFRSFRRRPPDLKGTDMTTTTKKTVLYLQTINLIWGGEGGRREEKEAGGCSGVRGLWAEEQWRVMTWSDVTQLTVMGLLTCGSYLLVPTNCKEKKRNENIVRNQKTKNAVIKSTALFPFNHRYIIKRNGVISRSYFLSL